MANKFHLQADSIMLGVLWTMAVYAIGLSSGRIRSPFP